MPWKRRRQSLITPRQTALLLGLALAAGALACLMVSKTSALYQLAEQAAAGVFSPSPEMMKKLAAQGAANGRFPR